MLKIDFGTREVKKDNCEYQWGNFCSRKSYVLIEIVLGPPGRSLSASFRGPLSPICPALEVALEALRTTRLEVKCRRPTTKHGEEGKLLGIQL